MGKDSGKQVSKKFHDVKSLEFRGEALILHVDQQSFEIPISRVSARLVQASDAARKFYRVSPGGYGIHWPEVDEDLTVDGLIRAAQAGATYKIPSEPSAQLRENEK